MARVFVRKRDTGCRQASVTLSSGRHKVTILTGTATGSTTVVPAGHCPVFIATDDLRHGPTR
jgi:hypothetical protein